jgi:peptide deformylase
LNVARLGNPILREKAKPVPEKDITSLEIQTLIRDMIETMREYGGVGVAAPQVHESVQIMVIDSLEDPDNPRKKNTPLTVLINPALTIVSEQLVEDWEGCLSIPDMRGLVPRHREIKVQAFDPSGKTVSFVARDFLARVIQHEYDHLMGEVFLDRMRDFASLTYLQEFSKYWTHKEPVEKS